MLPNRSRPFFGMATATIPAEIVPDLIALIDAERTATLNRLVTVTLNDDAERAKKLANLADKLTGQRATLARSIA